jgi:O-antigen ligase
MTFLNKILTKNIWKIILAIFVIEILSLISFKFAIVSGIFFILLLIIFALFTIYKLEHGLYIVLIELMIGSYGYLFYLDLPGFKMPIRLGLFLVLFIIWIVKYFNLTKYLKLLKKDRLTQNLAIFLVFIVIGVINGIWHENSLKSVFFDFNGYLYFGLFFIFLDVFKSKQQIIDFLKIFLASVIYLTLKVFLTLYIFTHGFIWLTDLFYTWIRDTRVGEITWAGSGFFRIFIQSQIFSLIAIFLVAIFIIKKSHKITSLKTIFKNKTFQLLFALLIIIQTSILISFSRSFWLGGFVGAILLLIYIIYIFKNQLKKIYSPILILLIGALASVILMITIVNFPIPKPSSALNSDFLKNRFTTGDAAASSRWNLLPDLLEENKNNPILGTGFGTEITYQTEDPRIKNESNPEGWYTTFTFEWGYLDTITEIGILGLLVYLIFIAQILWRGIKSSSNSLIATGFLIGLIALLVTHAFSPYLNHPLGIGYLMITASIFQTLKK